ncbi:hypothetical protein PInf_010104 [Phytophthora infestans]|nr:hypothetical protein PInf_010104 [Phytophthora infestans]
MSAYGLTHSVLPNDDDVKSTKHMNRLRQQIQQLKERRDLYVTRMIYSGERFKGDGFFAPRIHLNQDSPEASGGVYEYVVQEGRCPLTNRSITITSIDILAMVNNTTQGDAAREIRRICGIDGGCVVEVLAGLSGQVTQDTLIALFPHVIGDEVLTSRMIGRQIKFSSRLLLYFSNQRRLMKQVAQADLVAALNTLHLDDAGGVGAYAD